MTLTKLKENLYVPVDFEKNHNYYADPNGEKAYTGISSILGVLAKPALIPWAAKMTVEYIKENLLDRRAVSYSLKADMAEDVDAILEAAKSAHTRKKEEAGAHGTDAHLLVELWINALIAGYEAKPIPFLVLKVAGGKTYDLSPISKFMTWAEENVDHFLFSERRMSDPTLFIAGTADFAYIGKDGKKYMGDFKTSSGIYGIDYFLQVAAYRLLAESEGDDPYDGSAIVRLGKKGDFEAVYRFDYETDKKAFLACLEIYRAQATFVKPKTSWRK